MFRDTALQVSMLCVVPAYLYEDDLPLLSLIVSAHLQPVVFVGSEQKLLESCALRAAVKTVKPGGWKQGGGNVHDRCREKHGAKVGVWRNSATPGSKLSLKESSVLYSEVVGFVHSWMWQRASLARTRTVAVFPQPDGPVSNKTAPPCENPELVRAFNLTI